jgi:hypothetical protein
VSTRSNHLERQVLAMRPAEAKARLEQVGAAQSSVHFDWHGVAELAATRARREADTEWANVALYAYEMWSALTTDENVVHSSRSSAMNLRAYFIRLMGPDSGEEVLDARALVAMFEDGLGGTPEEVADKARDWTKLPVEEIRQLRHLKNRITPMELLDRDLLKEYPQVQRWMSIKSLLP